MTERPPWMSRPLRDGLGRRHKHEDRKGHHAGQDDEQGDVEKPVSHRLMAVAMGAVAALLARRSRSLCRSSASALVRSETLSAFSSASRASA